MATKTNLIANINAQLTAIITQAKVRLASSLVVDEIYPTSNQERYNVIGNLLSKTNFIDVDVFYDLQIKKSGNTVYVNGVVNNTGDSAFSGNFLSIVSVEFQEMTRKSVLK